MSNLQNIKIKVTPQTPVAEIVKALVKAGYRDEWNQAQYSDAGALYGYNDMSITRSPYYQDDFDNHENEERFVVNGKIVGKDYFTQPTTEKPLEEKTYEPLPEALAAIGAAIGEIKTAPTIPIILTRYDHERLRKIDLLKAMTACLESRQKVPNDWFKELQELHWEEHNRTHNCDEDF